MVYRKKRLYVAFTSKETDGRPVRFAIKPAGEDKVDEPDIPIESFRVISPPHLQVSRNGSYLVSTPGPDERVVMELKVKETGRYTGYEIVDRRTNTPLEVETQ